MPILFMMRTWKAPSEVWLQRMIEQLQDEIVLIAADDAQPYWNNKIPGFCMKPPIQSKPNCLLGCKVIKNLIYPERSIQEKLARYAKSLGVTKILINYATYALENSSLFTYIDAQLFVHCHGVDISFHGYDDNYPHQPIHHDSYTDNLLAFPNQTVFIANSKYTVGALKSIGINDANISLKYFGVDADNVFPERKIKKKLKILYLGRFIDCKGPDITIDAFNLARKNGLNAELIMAGEGPLSIACELKRLESKYVEDIHLLGSVTREEAANHFLQADIFTMHHRLGPLTNREEAFGVSILEAMAAGLPVVTGASGGVIELIVNQETGFLIESGSIKQHAYALLQLGEDYQLRQKLGKAGWKRARTEFTINNEKSNLMEIMKI